MTSSTSRIAPSPDPFADLVEELKTAAGHWCYHGRSGKLEEFATDLLAVRKAFHAAMEREEKLESLAAQPARGAHGGVPNEYAHLAPASPPQPIAATPPPVGSGGNGPSQEGAGGPAATHWRAEWSDGMDEDGKFIAGSLAAAELALCDAAMELPQCAGTVANRIQVYRQSYSDQIAERDRRIAELTQERDDVIRQAVAEGLRTGTLKIEGSST